MLGDKLIYLAFLPMLIAFWFLAFSTGGNTDGIEKLSPFLCGLLIFSLRLSDMTLDTLRLLFVMHGRKLLAGLVGFLQAAIFVVAITTVLKGEKSTAKILGYAAGFACGIMVGMTLEEKIALGFGHLRIMTKAAGETLAQTLRSAGHAATLMAGSGKDGPVTVINCIVRRKDITNVERLVQEADPEAFVTLDGVTPLHRGYFRF